MRVADICLHVKVVATVSQLRAMGIENHEVQLLLLSGKAFPVHHTYFDREGRRAIKLAHPITNEAWYDIYEEYTQAIH